MAEAAPDMRIRFTTSHPKDMSDATLEAMARHPNIARHVHLPVQSGSDKVLKDTNRKYTREWYLGRVAAIRRILPDAGISTDMLTGFHGESEEDFQLTLSLMREAGSTPRSRSSIPSVPARSRRSICPTTCRRR